MQIHQPRLAEMVADALRDRIIAGELKDGDGLARSERDGKMVMYELTGRGRALTGRGQATSRRRSTSAAAASSTTPQASSTRTAPPSDMRSSPPWATRVSALPSV